MIGDNPSPLSEAEKQHWRAQALKGEGVPLEITRRFIATIRVSIDSSPVKTAAAKKTRVPKQLIAEKDIPF